MTTTTETFLPRSLDCEAYLSDGETLIPVHVEYTLDSIDETVFDIVIFSPVQIDESSIREDVFTAIKARENCYLDWRKQTYSLIVK